MDFLLTITPQDTDEPSSHFSGHSLLTVIAKMFTYFSDNACSGVHDEAWLGDALEVANDLHKQVDAYLFDPYPDSGKFVSDAAVEMDMTGFIAKLVIVVHE